MLTHVVMFSFSDPADVAEATVRLRGLRGKIPSLLSLKCGTNIREGEHALQLVLVTEHESLAGLLAYIDHPVHRELAAWLTPRISRRAVVDTLDLA